MGSSGGATKKGSKKRSGGAKYRVDDTSEEEKGDTGRMGSTGLPEEEEQDAAENQQGPTQAHAPTQTGMWAKLREVREFVREHAKVVEDPHEYSIEFKEFVRYLCFLAVFCCVVFVGRNSDPYYLRRTVDSYFFDNEFTYGVSFRDIGSKEQFWEFLNVTIVPNVFPTYSYTGEPLSREEQRYLSDGSNFRLGTVRLRNIRLRPGLCSFPSALEDLLPGEDDPSGAGECYPTYRRGSSDPSEFEDKSVFYPGSRLANTSLLSWVRSEWKETGQPTYRSPGTKITYSGNGYVVDLGVTELIPPEPLPATDTVAPSPSPTEFEDHTPSPTVVLQDVDSRVQEQLTLLKNSEWLDDASRAVFVEFNLYNPNVDLFASVVMCVEFTALGAIIPTGRVVATPLLSVERVFTGESTYISTVVAAFMEFVLYALVFTFVAREVQLYRHARQNGKKFWTAWNIMETINLVIFIFVMSMRIAMLVEVSGLDLLRLRFMSEVQILSTRYKTIDGLLAINALLSFVKIFRFTSNNKHLGLLTRTLGACAKDMVILLLVICMVMVGFAIAFYLAFGEDLRTYMDLTLSVQSLLRCVLGDFDLMEITDSNHILGPLLFFLFIVVTFFVLLSMVLSVIDSSYDSVSKKSAKMLAKNDPLTNDVLYVCAKPLKYTEMFLDMLELALYKLENLERELGIISDEKKNSRAARAAAREEEKHMAAEQTERKKEMDERYKAMRKDYETFQEVIDSIKEGHTQLDNTLKKIDSRLDTAPRTIRASNRMRLLQAAEDEEESSASMFEGNI